MLFRSKMGTTEMKKIASIINIALLENNTQKAKEMVKELTDAFPLYKEIRSIYGEDNVNA